jgi:hypothetical protein
MGLVFWLETNTCWIDLRHQPGYAPIVMEPSNVSWQEARKWWSWDDDWEPMWLMSVCKQCYGREGGVGVGGTSEHDFTLPQSARRCTNNSETPSGSFLPSGAFSVPRKYHVWIPKGFKYKVWCLYVKTEKYASWKDILCIFNTFSVDVGVFSPGVIHQLPQEI